MRKMWSFLLAALALTGCAAAPADALPAAETAETAEMTATETEETAAQPVGFTVGNLSEVPNTCGGYWGWNTGDAYYEIARLDDENDQESMHALLLKTDYATAQQTVLCNVPGCTHDNAACPAWLEDWARTDVLVMPSGIYLSYAGLDDTSPWEQVEKACRDDFEQGNVKNFADEEAYIDYCRHNYELSSRPSSIEKLNDDLTARETVLTFDPSLLGSGYFAYCDENALYAKEYSDANNSRILRLDLTTGEWSTLPLNLGEQVLGVNGHRFLTSRLLTDAPLPDYNDREAYNAALQNARSELVWLDPATMQREKICETERLDGSTIYVKIYNDRVYVQDNPPGTQRVRHQLQPELLQQRPPAHGADRYAAHEPVSALHRQWLYADVWQRGARLDLGPGLYRQWRDQLFDRPGYRRDAHHDPDPVPGRHVHGRKPDGPDQRRPLDGRV